VEGRSGDRGQEPFRVIDEGADNAPVISSLVRVTSAIDEGHLLGSSSARLFVCSNKTVAVSLSSYETASAQRPTTWRFV